MIAAGSTCAAGALAALWLLGNAIESSPVGRCVCATARESQGWCSVHAVGYVAGVRVTSARLYEAVDVHGHDVDPATFPCPSCRRAIAADGYCEEHRIGFVRGDAYFSKLTYRLARGRVVRRSDIACPVCRKNSASQGWCDTCGIGMVGPVALKGRDDFDDAVAALRVLQIANEAAARCEHCAVAIVTDTECAVCRIRYKDGTARD